MSTHRTPYTRLMDMIPELTLGMDMNRTLEIIADRMEVLEAASRMARLVPAVTNSGPALRTRMEQATELMNSYKYKCDWSGEPPTPIAKPCSHNYKFSDSEPGKTHWCSLCGDRK